MESNDVIISASPLASDHGVCENRRRWIQTLVLASANFGMGLTSTLLATSMIHTSLLFDISMTLLSATMTLEAAGYLVGAIVCALAVHRIDYEFLAASSVLVVAMATACAPFGLPGFMTCLGIRGVASGFFYPSSSLYCLDTWQGHRYRDAAIQIQNAVFAVGATVAPFIAQVFLVDLEDQIDIDNSTSSSPDANDTWSSLSAPAVRHHHVRLTSFGAWRQTLSAAVRQLDVHNDDDDKDGNGGRERLERVRYAYVVIGMAVALSAVPAAFLYFRRGAPGPWLTTSKRRRQSTTTSVDAAVIAVVDIGSQPRRRSINHVDDDETSTVFSSGARRRRRPTSASRLDVGLYSTLLFLIGVAYSTVELTPRTYISAFATSRLTWSTADSSLLLSVFCAAFCVGRLIGVPVSFRLPPGPTLAVNVSVAAAGFAALLYAGLATSSSPAAVVWIGVAAVGLGASTMLGSIVVLLFDGRGVGLVRPATVSALPGIGVCVGAAAAALGVGALFDRWTPMCVVYAAVGGLVVLCVLLGVREAAVAGERRTRRAWLATDDDVDDVCVTETTPLLLDKNNCKDDVVDVTDEVERDALEQRKISTK